MSALAAEPLAFYRSTGSITVVKVSLRARRSFWLETTLSTMSKRALRNSSAPGKFV